MKILYTLGIFLCITAFRPQAQSNFVAGKLLSETTGQPVNKALVYIIKGEEENLSGIDGRFDVKTWQTYPLQLKISHPNFRDTVIFIRNYSSNIKIALHPKN